MNLFPTSASRRPARRSGPGVSRAGQRSVLLALTLALLGSSAWAAADSSEYEEKARMIGAFIRHTEWPERKLGQPGAPFIIGIYGSDQISGYLQEIFAGTSAKGRPTQIRILYSRADIPACHLLFVSASERDRLRPLLSEARREGVLTVGESDNFLANGGIIQFVPKPGGGWSYTPSVANAQRERLKLGGFLLRSPMQRSVLPAANGSAPVRPVAEAPDLRDP